MSYAQQIDLFIEHGRARRLDPDTSAQISNIRKRLLTVVQLQGYHPDREVVAVATVNLVLPEVLRIVKEAEKIRKSSAD